MKRKQFISAMLVGAMAVNLLAACGSNNDGPDNSKKAGGDSGEEITLQFWYGGNDEDNAKYAQKYADLFTEKYPNIKVELTSQSSTVSDVDTKLNAALLSGTYPDIIQVNLAQVGSRGALGDFLPIQSYVDSWDAKDEMFDSAYQMGMYEGELVAIGLSPNPQVWAYRKDCFEEAGLDPNTPPKTWSDMKEYAEKLTKREGDKVVFAGMDIPSIDSSLVFTEPFMRSAGSPVIDEVNLEPSFTDENAVRAMEFIAEMASLNVSIPHDQQNGDERPFVNGQAAMSNLSTGNLSQFKQNYPDVELGYMDPISEDGSKPGVGFCGYQLIALGATTKYPDEAFGFMTFMLSDEAIWERFETFGSPVVKNTLRDEYIDSGDPEMNAAVLNFVENGKGKAAVSWVATFNKHMALAYEEVINGKKPPADALNDADKALREELEEA